MFLPCAPTDEEKYLFVKTNRRPLYSVGVMSFLTLFVGMWLFTLSHTHFLWFGLFSILVTIYLSISYFIGIFGGEFNLRQHNQIRDSGYSEDTLIDIYLPCCGEDIEILKNTYKYVRELKEQYLTVKVYVLDDKGLPEVEAAARANQFEYISRPNKGELKKAGNMRYAFARTQGDFILVLDADFCPRKDFLKETMPYFHSTKTAIVQTPQYFRITDEQNWIQKGAAYVQELFYRLVQVNRNSFGGSICVGTNAIYRRKALEPFGGTAAIGYSEDVHTGFNVVKEGWKLEYLPINLAAGVCPDNMAGFFIQQYRWSMGSVTLFLNPEFWMSKLSFMQKICYLSGMLYYIVTGFSLFITSLPSLVLLFFVPEKVFWYNIFFSLPSFFYGTIGIALWSKSKFGWYAIKSKYISYYAHIFAIYDKFRDSAVAWIPSGAVKKVGRFYNFKNLIFVWSSVNMVAVSMLCAYRSAQYPWYNFIAPMFFVTFNFVVSICILKDQE